MSRIGRKPITIPNGVKVEQIGNSVKVTGPLGTLSREINPKIKVEILPTEVNVINPGDKKDLKKFHGLYRQLISNMVEGVVKPFTKKLVINGVGYKITLKGSDLVLNIGLSHPVEVKAVPGITFACDKTTITVQGIDKELVGATAAKIRDLKPVEPYHAYGIYYQDEKIIRKATKTGKK